MLPTFWLYVILLFFAGLSDAAADSQDSLTARSGKDSSILIPAPNVTISDNQPTFKISGFGSLGVLHSSQSVGDYVLESSLPSGAGRSNNWDTSNFSKLAVQLNGYFTPKITAQFQVISAYDTDGSFQPDIEWLNLKYAFNQNAYIRVGRIGLPTFFDSGNHDVGYSYPWTHPPSELYYLLPIQSSDGIDAMYRFRLGEARNSVKAIYGENKFDTPIVSATAKDLWGIFDTLEYGETTIHASYQQRNTSLHNNFTGSIEPNMKSSDISVGINYDPGAWFVTSEWIQSRTSYMANAIYAGLGFRINKYTPYIVHSQNTPGSYSSGSTPSVFNLQLANRCQSTNSIGIRWDFKKNFDAKFQYDQVKLSDNSNGFLVNIPVNQTLYGSTFSVISAVVDFIF
jgi:hypothetical protein